MRRVSAFRSRFVFQAAGVALLAGMSAACTNSVRLSEPFFTGSTENQRQIIGNSGNRDVAYADQSAEAGYQPMPSRVATSSVSRSELPPPPAPTASRDYAMADPIPAPAEATPSGWSPVGGKVITLGATDTLDNLAAKYGVPQDQLLAVNQLTSPNQIRAGRVLVVPRRVAMSSSYEQPAMPQTAYAAQPEPAPIQEAPKLVASGATSYVVQPGDTLFGIARRNGVNVQELAATNGLTTASGLQVGQTLRLNGAGAMAGTQQLASAAPLPATRGAPEKPLGQLRVNADGTALAAAAPTAQPMIKLPAPGEGTAQASLKPPAMPSIPVQSQQTAATAVSVDAAADEASTDGKSFRWPVRGRIISGFGTKANGERNDGINLAVPEGTSVKAVEAGTVIYAGNELEGYGNLVLVRHADGWVSAYAHNKEIMVKRGDQVRRGQTVSQAGMSGSVSSPQVHFELRKGAKPVNPLDYLAGT